MIFNKKVQIDEFITKLVKITPEEFIALTEILGVRKTVKDESSNTGYAVRDAEDMIVDCVANFKKLPHKARTAILKAMDNRENTNGATSADPTNE